MDRKNTPAGASVPTLLGVVALALGSWSAAPAAGEPSAAAPSPPVVKNAPVPPDPVVLVRQLGDASYARREEAARALSELGVRAKKALEAGLRDADAEIRRSCRMLLGEVLEADFAARLAAFEADKEGTQPSDLPCWGRFRELFGNSPESRALFAEMARAEPILLETAQGGGEATVALFVARWKQILQAIFIGDHLMRQQATFGRLAALVFVGLEMELSLPAELRDNGLWLNVFQQPAFQEALTRDGPRREVARKLFGRWMFLTSCEGGNLIQKLQLAVQYQVPDGVHLGLRAIDDAKSLTPQWAAAAAAAVARLGGKPYAAALVPLLKDERKCLEHRMSVNGKPVTRSVQVRDIALTWIVTLTGQDLADYGLGDAKAGLERLQRQRGLELYDLSPYRFADDEKRDAALKRLDQWLKEHPLEKLPERPKLGKPPPAAAVPAGGAQIRGPVIVLGGGAVVWGNPAAAPPTDKDTLGGLLLADRLEVKKVQDAGRLIDQGQHSEAIRLLGAILQRPGDSFFRPDRRLVLYRRLKAEAERLVGRMDPAGLARYEAEYGAAARRKLDAAIATGDIAALGEVAESYFYTQAGGEATYLLGVHWRALGEAGRAAAYLARLEGDPRRVHAFGAALPLELAACHYRAGAPQAAAAILARWKDRAPEAAAVLGGGLAATLAPQDAAAWLEATFGPSGQPGAAPPSPWGPIGRVAFAQDLEDDPLILGLLERMAAQQPARIAASGALIQSGVLVVRGTTVQRAVDFESGRLLWQTRLDDPLARFLRRATKTKQELIEQLRGLAPAEKIAAPAAPAPRPRPLIVHSTPPEAVRLATLAQVSSGLKRRMWNDPGYAGLSGDGRRVFFLDDGEFPVPADDDAAVLPDGRRYADRKGGKDFNRLAAADLRSGKLAWEVGGPPGAGGELAGALFLGPPLPIEARLYVVAQLDGQTQLIELDAARGKPQHQWKLAHREEFHAQARIFMPWGPYLPPQPRLNSTPIRGGNVLVCRAAEGRFVAIDLSTRQTVWLFDAPLPASPGAGGVVWPPREPEDDGGAMRWSATVLAAAGDLVLLSPARGEELFALAAADGSLRWSVPRGDGLYVTVAGDKVLIVGREQVRAVRLEDGQPAWADPEFLYPRGAVPSGRGHLAGAHYCIPLSTGEICGIDLSSGRFGWRSPALDGKSPGNLAGAEGALVSRTLQGFCRFESWAAAANRLDEAFRLHPEDPQLLVQRGAQLLGAGKTREAAEHFRRAAEGDVPPEAAAALRGELLQGLHADFAAFETLASRLEPLFAQPADRLALAEELAAALARTGRREDALGTYLKCLDMKDLEKLMLERGSARQIRADVLLRARLADVYAAAAPAEAARIDERIAEALRAAGSPDELQRRLAVFNWHPAANAARLQRACALLAGDENFLAAERLLRRVAEEGMPPQRAEAVARLAELLRRAARPAAVAEYYRQLAGPLEKTACLDGRSGRQLADALAADDPLRKLLERGTVWPAAPISCETASRGALEQALGVPRILYPIPGVGDTPAQWFVDQARRQLVRWPDGMIADAAGGELSLDAVLVHSQFLGRLGQGTEARSDGHLAAIAVGDRVCAVDGLAGELKLLWSRPCAEPLDRLGAVQPPARLRNPAVGRAFPGAAASPLVLTADAVCFQEGRKLHAVDPLSGAELWLRDDLPADCDLLGDGRVLLLTPPGGDEAIVLSATDGRTLARRPVPPLARRVLACGRDVVTWEAAAGGARLARFDPWNQRVVWQRRFPGASHARLIDSTEIAVLDAAGNLALIELAEGKDRLAAKVPVPQGLVGIVVLRWADRYLLLTDSSTANTANVGIEPLPGDYSVGGMAYALDAASGAILWSATIPDQRVNVGQPRDLPMLICFRRYVKQTPRPDGRGHNNAAVTHLLCIDKRDGRILCDKSLQGFEEMYQVRAEPPRKLTVAIGQQAIEFRVAGEGPRSPESPPGDVPGPDDSRQHRNPKR